MEITFEQAKKAADLAEQKARELKVPVNIVVTDYWGHLKYFVRMDTAFLGSIDIAFKKAKTSMLFRADSEAVGEYVKPEAKAYGLTDTSGGLLGFAGGKPIISQGKIIGYIGVSGGAVVQDQLIATAGSEI